MRRRSATSFVAVFLCTTTFSVILASGIAFGATKGEMNALHHARNYLNIMAFSRSGLIEQLEFEGYSHSEAVYAVENCGADWKEQAAKKAENYLLISPFSRSGLIEQLMFEGFSREQAVYGVEKNGY